MNHDLRIRAISKRFARGEPAIPTTACDAITLELTAATHVCVMGASGSGKTTLLRIVAGLEHADAGALWIGEQRIDTLPPERRPTRTAFQTPALFPHLDALANVTFVDRLRPRPTGAPAISGEQLLDQLGLAASEFATRSILTLSGGERQRVALARTLYRAPAWILLDEPFSALDRPLRASLRRSIAAVRREAGVAILHVTHEAEDALALADTLVLLDRGRVLAVGEPESLYRHPPDLVSARLLGELSPSPDPGRPGYLRPERLRIVAAELGRTLAKLRLRSFAGSRWEHELEVGDRRESILVFSSEPWQGPDTCGLTWDDTDVLQLERG